MYKTYVISDNAVPLHRLNGVISESTRFNLTENAEFGIYSGSIIKRFAADAAAVIRITAASIPISAPFLVRFFL